MWCNYRKKDSGIIADDLTSASDAGMQLVHAGYRTAVTFYGASGPQTLNVDAVVCGMDSRSLPPMLDVCCQDHAHNSLM